MKDFAKIRTLHVAAGLESESGGPPVSISNFWACSLAVGIRAEVIGTKDPAAIDPPLSLRLREAGAEVRLFDRNVGFGRNAGRWGISFKLVRWLLGNVKNYDLVVIHSAWLFSSLGALLAARLWNRPCILVPHGSLTDFDVGRPGSTIRRTAKTLIRRVYWRFCSSIIFASQLESRESAIPGKSAKTLISPHPVFDDRDNGRDLRPLARAPKRSETMINVGFIGRIHANKNVGVTISALSQLPKNFILTIAGDGPSALKRPLEELAVERGVSDRVKWIGFVGGASKEAFFSEIDVLVMPSIHESFGLAAAEALVRGVPAIVTTRSGIAEILTEFGGGLTCEPNETHLVNRLKEFGTNTRLRTELGRQATSVARSQLSFTVFGQRLKDHYVSLLLQSGRRQRIVSG
jgi:glycosyltransferase involved in cell wall biosynthesis